MFNYFVETRGRIIGLINIKDGTSKWWVNIKEYKNKNCCIFWIDSKMLNKKIFEEKPMQYKKKCFGVLNKSFFSSKKGKTHSSKNKKSGIILKKVKQHYLLIFLNSTKN